MTDQMKKHRRKHSSQKEEILGFLLFGSFILQIKFLSTCCAIKAKLSLLAAT